MARTRGLYQYIYKGKRIKMTPPFIHPSFFRGFVHTFYKVSEHDRLDKIAFEYYDGQAELAWIIKMANGMGLSTDMKAGDVLLIPLDYRSVLQAIQNKNSE